jgi:hypothetical protein
MKKNFVKFDFTLPTYCLPYLINGDVGDMTEEEIIEIDQFCENLQNTYGPGHWATEGEETFFSWRNDINRLGSECATVCYIASKDE